VTSLKKVDGSYVVVACALNDTYARLYSDILARHDKEQAIVVREPDPALHLAPKIGRIVFIRNFRFRRQGKQQLWPLPVPARWAVAPWEAAVDFRAGCPSPIKVQPFTVCDDGLRFANECELKEERLCGLCRADLAG